MRSEICHLSLSAAEMSSSTCVWRPILEMRWGKDRSLLPLRSGKWPTRQQRTLRLHRTHNPSECISSFDLVSTQSGIAAFSFYRSKAERGGGLGGGLMMLLWAIWQLDHNRWRLAIRPKQRAFREHTSAQNVSIIKAWLSLINPPHSPLSSPLRGYPWQFFCLPS